MAGSRYQPGSLHLEVLHCRRYSFTSDLVANRKVEAWIFAVRRNLHFEACDIMGRFPPQFMAFFQAYHDQTRFNKLFIDLGAYAGQSVLAFLTWKSEAAKDYDIISFEANIEFIQKWIDNILPLQQSFRTVNLIPCVVGSGSSNQLVSFDGWKLAEIQGAATHRQRLAPAFDFITWFKSIIAPDQEIILKIDIEGAEYELIEKMVSHNLLRNVTTLFMEIHGPKHGFDISRTNQLIHSIYEAGAKPYLWETTGNSILYDPKVNMARIVPNDSDTGREVDFEGIHKIILEPASHTPPMIFR